MISEICAALAPDADRQFTGEEIRIRGTVQGVGFRPHVWRIAHECDVVGEVFNDSDGVLIRAWGQTQSVNRFVHRLRAEAPPLAWIDAVDRRLLQPFTDARDFCIVESRSGGMHTAIVADTVSCAQCVAETLDPSERRYRYPFTNCTHCGPRLSIIEEVPYDRSATTMREYLMCPKCRAEYTDPGDRRFHAQPIACPACGPQIWICAPDGTPQRLNGIEALRSAITSLENGQIVAIKGLGGYQLACNACDEAVVARLRRLKRREQKPFGLLARDIDVIRRYCELSPTEESLLKSPAGPIVILRNLGVSALAASVAPGVRTLGFMLPSTPLHHLIVHAMDQPLVLTSGNLTDEPQCIDNADAISRLGRIADWLVMHDRDIARRVDDSVARVMAGAPRILRRARGYTPMPLKLPEGFAACGPVLAMGAELKNTFCLFNNSQAMVSHHLGDLENAPTYADYQRSIQHYLDLFQHDPETVALDLHPDYLSSKFGRELAERLALPIVQVQHHHAHIASCMVENSVPLDAPRLLGIALDGLGLGERGELWGGEFLEVGYDAYRRLASLKPVPMPGGSLCMREPWRNAYAHLVSAMGWQGFASNFSRLDLYQFLSERPIELLHNMVAKGVNSPIASSCGRLFDAVAAAVGVCRERARYEGQAAIEFEALVDEEQLKENDSHAYRFSVVQVDRGPFHLDPAPMWEALLSDLDRGTAVPRIAARFHLGLASSLARLAEELWASDGAFLGPKTVALSGGVFQNRVLLEQLTERLQRAGFQVLTHSQIPSNDGGLSLGQAAIAAAKSVEARQTKRSSLCV